MRSKKVSSSFKGSMSIFRKLIIELKKCTDKKCGNIMSKKDLKEYKKEMSRIINKCSKKKNYKDVINCTHKENKKSKILKKHAPIIKKKTICIKKNCL